MTSVFYLFRDSPQRRAALALEPRAPARYALYGMDELAERCWAVRHNLESAAPGRTAAVAGAAVKRGVEAAGGYGGDFATVLASLREVNRADVVAFGSSIVFRSSQARSLKRTSPVPPA